MMKRAMMLAMPLVGLFVAGCDATTAYTVGISAGIVGGALSLIEIMLKGLGVE